MVARKSPAYAALKHKLDAEFSEWIRRSNADASGVAKCATCGASRYWKYMDCGHFFKRVHLGVRWDERNAAPQCEKCNRVLGGNLIKFEAYIIERYGREALNDMEMKKYVVVKLDRDALNRRIAEFKAKISALPSEDRTARW